MFELKKQKVNSGARGRISGFCAANCELHAR